MALKDDFIRTLNKASIQHLNFSVGGHNVAPAIYAPVRNYLADGTMTARKSPTLNGLIGKYVFTPNRFDMGFSSTDGDFWKEALVVHESTHAAFDVLNPTMTVKVSEALAYLAQALYIYHENKAAVDDGAEPEFDSGSEALAAAWPLSVAARSETKRYSESECQPIFDALGSMDLYRGRLDNDEDLDGVEAD